MEQEKTVQTEQTMPIGQKMPIEQTMEIEQTMQTEQPIQQEKENTYDIIIIGAGTAGLSAAIYGVRAGKKVLVLEEGSYGGQIIVASEIENYPGIAKVSGFEFAQGLYDQAIKLGAEICFEQAEEVQLLESEKVVQTAKHTYHAKSVIVATGAKNRSLGLEHEKEWTGRGISYCATCDGAFYKGKDVAVVGGGNTALEDALFLTQYCRKVYLIHRRDTFRGEETLLETLKKKENLVFLLCKKVVEIKGENRLQAITVEDVEKGRDKQRSIDIVGIEQKDGAQNDREKKMDLEVDGLFIAIGQEPDNQRFSNILDLDEKGYIMAGEDCRTNINGIFAAGDCRTKEVRQLVTAAADGAVAALAACQG